MIEIFIKAEIIKINFKMKNFLETIILLSVAGMGIFGLMPDKLGIKPYNKDHKIDSLYKIKQDSLENWYFSKLIK